MESNDTTMKSQDTLDMEDKDILKQQKSIDRSERKKESSKETINDYEIVGHIGQGAYGNVSLVRKKETLKLYAMKALSKNFLRREKKQYQAYIEREVLRKLNHPNIIKLYSSFQDNSNLYFIMEYCENGMFSDLLRIYSSIYRKIENLDDRIKRFYIAELVDIIEYLHKNGVAHRDIKPENILLSSTNHLKMIDFGTALFFNTNLLDQNSLERITKIKEQEKYNDETVEMDNHPKHRATFVGTAEYVCPELLVDDECSYQADLWALGCIIYKIYCHKTPFSDNSEYLIFQKIKKCEIPMPDEVPQDAREIIRALLDRDPRKRLGSGEKGSGLDFEALKSHQYFKDIDFKNLPNYDPPIEPITSVFKVTNNYNPDEFEEETLSFSKQFSNDEVSINKPMSPTGIVMTGLVLKKCGWVFYKPRQLIIYETPRILYYDPQTSVLKGEIPLLPETKAEATGKSRFIIQVPGRKYYFKELEHPVEKWIAEVNKLIKILFF